MGEKDSGGDQRGVQRILEWAHVQKPKKDLTKLMSSAANR